MSETIQEDVIGLGIEVTMVAPDTGLPVDLTSVLTITYIFLSPAGNRNEYSGDIFGTPTDGVVVFVLNGEIDEPGTWKFQVRITFTGQTLFSEVAKIKVKANL